MKEVKESLKNLNALHQRYIRQTEALQQQYADANYYIRLLSAPDDSLEGADAELNQIGTSREASLEERGLLNRPAGDV